MTRRLLAIYLLLTAITLLVVELPFGLTFADREERSLLSSIERDARVIAFDPKRLRIASVARVAAS